MKRLGAGASVEHYEKQDSLKVDKVTFLLAVKAIQVGVDPYSGVFRRAGRYRRDPERGS
jgi:hypothetical protein